MSAKLKTGADAKALRTMKFPPEFNEKVDMTKVNISVIQKWVSREVTKILKDDDDVVTEMIFELLRSGRYPNIKQLQADVSGFLDKDAPRFCLELWKLCLSAQANPSGVPNELLEAKKQELMQERMAEEKAQEEAMKRQEAERERERELASDRDRERNERGRGGRGRYGRDFGRRGSPSRDSRSPPRQRDGDSFYGASPRGADRYVPRSRGRWNDNPRRRQRSPSYGRSASRSRSPPRQRRRRNTSSSRSRSSTPRRYRGSGSDFRRGARSPSPRRDQRPSSGSSRAPTPPRYRERRPSPSRSRSPPGLSDRARADSYDSPPPGRKRRSSNLASDDLMSRNDGPGPSRRNEGPRLSRETSLGIGSTPSRSLEGVSAGAEQVREENQTETD